jgi:hypothetical protein
MYQAGLFDKVIAELRKFPRCDFDVNIPDEVSGLTPLHIAAAAGAMVSTSLHYNDYNRVQFLKEFAVIRNFLLSYYLIRLTSVRLMQMAIVHCISPLKMSGKVLSRFCSAAEQIPVFL